MMPTWDITTTFSINLDIDQHYYKSYWIIYSHLPPIQTYYSENILINITYLWKISRESYIHNSDILKHSYPHCSYMHFDTWMADSADCHYFQLEQSISTLEKN